jgi:UDP-4-amino-4-deoxy-L-arabinose-oxoglutarate aminotransferase
VDLIRERPGIRHGRHLFTILAPQGRRDDLLAELQARGVGVAVNYRAVHLLAYYRERFGYRPGLFPNAEAIGDRTLTLPLYPSLSDEDVEYVIESVREGVASLG